MNNPVDRPPIDPAAKKQVLRLVTYGLYVLTSAADGDLAAGTITWLSQASFVPPLVMAGVRRDGHVHAVVERSGTFAVNVVGAGQREIASAFFRPSVVTAGRISGYAFERGRATGAPILTDLPAWFEARVTDAVRRGDHTIFVAELVACGVRDPAVSPLALSDTSWSYAG
ncbi:MAG TPA: flavin reductase family protein [Gemmatimonadales bacterium]|nr:flavin reductase family protein [Gemmatimonadales bacterium]